MEALSCPGFRTEEAYHDFLQKEMLGVLEKVTLSKASFSSRFPLTQGHASVELIEKRREMCAQLCREHEVVVDTILQAGREEEHKKSAVSETIRISRNQTEIWRESLF